MNIVRWLIGLLCALCAAQAMAGATATFGGASVPGCTLSGSSYTCSSLPLVNYDDGIVIASGYTVNVNSAVAIGYNQSLTMSGTATLKVTGNLNVGDINPSNIHVSGGSFQTTGAFSYGAQQQNMTVNVTAASMNLGTGSAGSITGTLSASGAIAVGSHMTVNGPLSGSTITTTSPVTINGNISATSAFTLASGSTVTGNITAPTVTLQPSSATVTGNITASNALTVGSGNTVRGDVTTGTLTMESSGGAIIGNATVASATLGYQTTVTNNIYCTAGNAANCGCVSDSSGYPSGSANAPSCSAPPSSATAPHHIQVNLSGSGVTCAPQTVTITACANAACTAPHYTGNASVTLSPGGGVFGTGSTGVNSTATLRRTTAGTVPLTATSQPVAGGATVCVNSAGGTGCSSAWVDAGFLFTVPNHIAAVGQTINVSAVRTDSKTLACTPAFGADKTVALSCAYDNPATGNFGMSVGPTASALSALACAAGTSANVTLKFDATGVAPLSLSYADVGQLTLNVNYAGTAIGGDANLAMAGASQFIASPKDCAAAPTRPPTPTPPVDATSAAFIKAGATFKATVTARNNSNVTTPNFGKETAPAEAVTMSSTLVAPGGGTNPALTDAADTTPAFVSGVSTRTLSWGEVGIIKLTATLASTGYLGTGNKTTGTSANVGRFTPAYFTTVLGIGVAQTCPSGLTCAPPGNKFVYSAQAFPVTVTAYNTAGGVTSNYASSATAANAFARTVTLTAWDAPGSTTTANPPATATGSAMSTNTSGTATFVGGIGAINPTYTFAAKFPAAANLAPPTNIYVRATDSDAVSSDRDAASTEMGLMVVGGRLAIRHSYGSELLAMTETVTAQYWNGTRYANSTTDNLSSFAPANVVLFNCLKNLNNGGTSCKPVVGVAASQGTVVLSKGVGNFRLNAPGTGNGGSVDVMVNAPAWLPSATGRIMYGIYSSPILYFQEVH
jgi:MSHA biogenesis protein MshQ